MPTTLPATAGSSEVYCGVFYLAGACGGGGVGCRSLALGRIRPELL